MPAICEHCGKEHETLEELQQKEKEFIEVKENPKKVSKKK
jgi:hypothetical protein